MKVKQKKTRRRKKCPSCGKENALAKYVCECSHVFVPKERRTRSRRNKKPKLVICKNWRKLEKGDPFKIKRGTGPYTIVNEEKYYMGYSGLFEVKRIDEEGIIAIPARSNKTYNGFCYIYMGKKKKRDSGTIAVPHVILTLQKIQNNDQTKRSND